MSISLVSISYQMNTGKYKLQSSFSSYHETLSCSNPVMGITRYILSPSISGVEGIVRNTRHDDLSCPYDMHDGWEVLDKDTNSWVEDNTLTVACV